LTLLCLVFPATGYSYSADSTSTFSDTLATAEVKKITEFSFAGDMIFHDPADLIGYTFVPNRYVRSGRPLGLEPGDVVIEFTETELIITGIEGLDKYYVSDLERMPYGFRVHLLQSANPSAPLVMFIRADNDGFVDQLTFPTLNEGTHGFSIPVRSDDEMDALDELYSNIDDFEVEKIDTLFDQEWIPWLMVADIAYSPQVEQMDGSTKIIFEEDLITVKGGEASNTYEYKELKYLAHGSPHALNTTYTISAILKREKAKGKKGKKKSTLYIQLNPQFQIVEIIIGRVIFYPRP
jgi:hypothetical protein